MFFWICIFQKCSINRRERFLRPLKEWMFSMQILRLSSTYSMNWPLSLYDKIKWQIWLNISHAYVFFFASIVIFQWLLHLLTRREKKKTNRPVVDAPANSQVRKVNREGKSEKRFDKRTRQGGTSLEEQGFSFFSCSVNSGKFSFIVGHKLTRK